MLEEISEAELLALAMLGNISIGLVIHSDACGIILDNLKIRDGQTYYYSQTEGFLETWGEDTSAIDMVKSILRLDPNVCPNDWMEILKIYHIEE